MTKFDEIASKVPIDKRGQIFGEIWFPTLIHFSDICDHEKLNNLSTTCLISFLLVNWEGSCLS